MTVIKYDPENWLVTLIRGVESYITDALVERNLVDAYEVVMEFPGADLDTRKMPMSHTIVHFEVDDIQDRRIGMGMNIFASNYNETDETVQPQEAKLQMVNLDVGIWASAKSGGTTARLRMRQLLSDLFAGSLAFEKFRLATDGGDGGIHIVEFTGGRFVNDTIGDVPVYRMVGGNLDLQVYSRTPILDSDTPIPAISEIVQEPNLTTNS